MTRASADGGQQPAEDVGDALRNDDVSTPHTGTLPTEREGATRLILSDGDAGRVAVHWRVAAPDLRHLRSVFPHGADPTPVIQLIRLSESGGAELVERVPLSDADLLPEGKFSFDLSGGELAVQAELGLGTPAGGWLLLVRSNPVTVAAEIIAEAPVVASPVLDPLHVEPALAATGADLVPVFPEVTDAAVPAASVSIPVVEGDDAIEIPLVAADPSVCGVADLHREPDGDGSGEGAALTHDGADHARNPSAVSSVVSAPLSTRGDTALPTEQPRSSSYRISEPRYGVDGDSVEVHTELWVHGRARPGSAIDLFGHRIQVGSGGRFSLRLPVSNSQLLQQALDQGMPLMVRSYSDS